ncbi:uncharacterized protein EHS24_003464 [Apiotrichum porosum]|uniref:Isochorismatase-like domain-containing protein n=1 Tax=Apiotrichum porosum TaxID=105984 RepID=A0A427XFE6_9TREE|nr:uncharacterized protein EHS24_003464 [Apiotrichum porosum]RSH77487.1 hypothetical protein EHS24_003464 [Apiotrichum porosum]
MATALVVVDVQVGVVATCWDVPAVVGRIADLVQRARAAGAPVIWVQHDDDPHLKRDSSDWALVPELVPNDGEVRIYKQFRDSFSVPLLEETLRERGVDHLVIVGSQSDFCVRTTAQGALSAGFNVTLPRDAHTTEDIKADGVAVSAQQIVAHTNYYFDNYEFLAGVKSRVVSSNEVEFK